MIKPQKIFYYEYDHYVDENGKEYCRVELTTDEQEAKEIDENYRLATIEEVNEFIGLGFEPIPVIEVQEGIYGWYEQEYINSFGNEEMFVGYVWLQPNSEWEIKDLVDMMKI